MSRQILTLSLQDQINSGKITDKFTYHSTLSINRWRCYQKYDPLCCLSRKMAPSHDLLFGILTKKRNIQWPATTRQAYK